MLTDFTSEASEASLVDNAPTELVFRSNQLISCLSIALKYSYRKRFVSLSPATDKLKFCV